MHKTICNTINQDISIFINLISQTNSFSFITLDPRTLIVKYNYDSQDNTLLLVQRRKIPSQNKGVYTLVETGIARLQITDLGC